VPKKRWTSRRINEVNSAFALLCAGTRGPWPWFSFQENRHAKATLALIAPSALEASFAGATDTPEKTVPQGQDPPGADNGQQLILPRAEDKEVIPPPPIGDEDI
jgi:hypothetical protein